MGEEAERTIPECLPGPAFCHSPMGWRLGAGATGLGIGIGCDYGKKDGGRLAEVGTSEPESHGGSCSFMPLDAWVRVPSRAGKQTRETDTHIYGCLCTHLPLRDWELWKPAFLGSLPESLLGPTSVSPTILVSTRPQFMTPTESIHPTRDPAPL